MSKAVSSLAIILVLVVAGITGTGVYFATKRHTAENVTTTTSAPPTTTPVTTTSVATTTLGATTTVTTTIATTTIGGSGVVGSTTIRATTTTETTITPAITETCCDNSPGSKNGYASRCQIDINLAAGMNNVCWGSEWDDYGNNRDYYSGWFRCPDGYYVGVIWINVSLADQNDCIITYLNNNEERSSLCGDEYSRSSYANTSWIKFRFKSGSSGVDDGVLLKTIECIPSEMPIESTSTTSTAGTTTSSTSTSVSTTTSTGSTTTTTSTTTSTTTTTECLNYGYPCSPTSGNPCCPGLVCDLSEEIFSCVNSESTTTSTSTTSTSTTTTTAPPCPGSCVCKCFISKYGGGSHCSCPYGYEYISGIYSCPTELSCYNVEKACCKKLLPSVTLEHSDGMFYQGDSFYIKFTATDDKGIDQMELEIWNENMGDSNEYEYYNCLGITPCSHTFNVILTQTGLWQFELAVNDTDGYWTTLFDNGDMILFTIYVSPSTTSSTTSSTTTSTSTTSIGSTSTSTTSESTTTSVRTGRAVPVSITNLTPIAIIVAVIVLVTVFVFLRFMTKRL
jgi:hypothetical protein